MRAARLREIEAHPTAAFIGLFNFMKVVALEYSDEQQCFHYNMDGRNQNTNGYRTIAYQVDNDRANEFVNYIDTVYPGRELTVGQMEHEADKFFS
jgi:hypothetical protein